MTRKLILSGLLVSILFTCTACRKNSESPEIIQATSMVTEAISTESETVTSSNLKTTSDTVATIRIETNSDTVTSITNTTNTTKLSSSTTETSIESSESALHAEMQEALQIAIDEEERQAIQDVQPETEPLIYYKNPTLNFKPENFQNLGIDGYGFTILTSDNGNNVHKYFFEAEPMSGKHLLQMQKIANHFADTAINIEKVRPSAETLEHSEYLQYKSNSLYMKLQNTGECLLYCPDNIQEFTGEEIVSDDWNPLDHSTSLGAVTGYGERNYVLDGEATCLLDIHMFLIDYLEQAQLDGWLSSVYDISSIQDCELLEFPNGVQAFYLTLQLSSGEVQFDIDNTQKSAFLDNEQQIHAQEIKLLMFRPDAIAYMQLPATLTQEPDHIETLPGTYCTLNEACAIISDYLPQEYIYHVTSISIIYETLFLYQDTQYLGIVQTPMWHFVIDNSPDSDSPYQPLYADIDIDTQQLYISYQ